VIEPDFASLRPNRVILARPDFFNLNSSRKFLIQTVPLVQRVKFPFLTPQISMFANFIWNFETNSLTKNPDVIPEGFWRSLSSLRKAHFQNHYPAKSEENFGKKIFSLAMNTHVPVKNSTSWIFSQRNALLDHKFYCTISSKSLFHGFSTHIKFVSIKNIALNFRN